MKYRYKDWCRHTFDIRTGAEKAMTHLGTVVNEDRIVGESDRRDFKLFLVVVSVPTARGLHVHDGAAPVSAVLGECRGAFHSFDGAQPEHKVCEGI